MNFKKREINNYKRIIKEILVFGKVLYNNDKIYLFFYMIYFIFFVFDFEDGYYCVYVF